MIKINYFQRYYTKLAYVLIILLGDFTIMLVSYIVIIYEFSIKILYCLYMIENQYYIFYQFT